MITTQKSGVWILWDSYAKANKEVYPYVGAPTLFAWGNNFSGQLSQNNRTPYSSPIQIPGTTWSSISANSRSNGAFSLATKTDGTLWSWGSNSYGQLGQNNTTQYSSPVQIPGTTWSSVSAAYNHTLATKTDGTLWAWGSNNNGILGQNNTTNISSPVQIPGTTWRSVSGGQSHSLATKTDGTLWAWGSGLFSGAIGQNNQTQYSSPIQIPGTTWSSIDAGHRYSLATKTDNTLWSWGFNTRGQLGQNNTTYYSSPIQIPGTTWSSISAGAGDQNAHSLATKTDGTLWSWGYNGAGRLGQNTTAPCSSPVQIPGTTWSSVSSGSYHTLAIKNDGTLWSWGYNDSGRLGQNNQINYSSPVQVPGTTWSSISAGGLGCSLGIRIQ